MLVIIIWRDCGIWEMVVLSSSVAVWYLYGFCV